MSCAYAAVAAPEKPAQAMVRWKAVLAIIDWCGAWKRVDGAGSQL